jgi:hypothetical protein
MEDFIMLKGRRIISSVVIIVFLISFLVFAPQVIPIKVNAAFTNFITRSGAVFVKVVVAFFLIIFLSPQSIRIYSTVRLTTSLL